MVVWTHLALLINTNMSPKQQIYNCNLTIFTSLVENSYATLKERCANDCHSGYGQSTHIYLYHKIGGVVKLIYTNDRDNSSMYLQCTEAAMAFLTTVCDLSENV